MTEKKLHYCVLTVSLLMSVSIYIDAYFSPLEPHAEVATKMWSEMHRAKGVTFSYHVATLKHSYRIPPHFYSIVNVNDTIIVLRSTLTNVVQKMSTISGSRFGDYYDTGIIRVDSSFVFMVVAPVGIIVLFIFYNFIPSKQGKKNLTYFSFGSIASFLNCLLNA